MLWCISVVCFTSTFVVAVVTMLCGIAFDSYITMCLLIHQIMDIWVVSSLGQL